MGAAELGGFDLPERNRRAKAVIEATAMQHAACDSVIGLGGILVGLFIPGAGLAATAGALLAQFPFYRRLAQDLSEIYESPQDVITKRMLHATILADTSFAAAADVSVPVGEAVIADQFSVGFFGEIAGELVGESTLAALGSFMPLVGGGVAMWLDVSIAATMTWRVGMMVSAYYQNGGKWVGGGRRETHDAVASLVGGLSPGTHDRYNLDDLARDLPEVFETQVAEVVVYIKQSVLDLRPTISRDELTAHLINKPLPRNVVDAAVLRIFRG